MQLPSVVLFVAFTFTVSAAPTPDLQTATSHEVSKSPTGQASAATANQPEPKTQNQPWHEHIRRTKTVYGGFLFPSSQSREVVEEQVKQDFGAAGDGDDNNNEHNEADGNSTKHRQDETAKEVSKDDAGNLSITWIMSDDKDKSGPQSPDPV